MSYLNLGNDIVLDENDIIAVFDTDNITSTKRGGEYLLRAEKNGNVINSCKNSFPRSFIVACSKEKDEEIVYLSNISVPTILKSIRKGGFLD